MREYLSQLNHVEQLLLKPEPAEMLDVQRRLAGVIESLTNSGHAHVEPSVQNSVRNIRFLLDRAKHFWDRRRAALAPGIQYSSRGVLMLEPSKSTFTVEV